MKQNGYHATRNPDGTLTIHRVPIFVACKRGDAEFNDAWLAAAVVRAKLAEADGYLPPLHCRHHGDVENVRPAGFFRVLGTEGVSFKGTTRLAILADLILTDPMVQLDVLAKRLPYRSVEIVNVDVPGICSLALLDHEAPYLELPMLMVAAVDDRTGRPSTDSVVASATFKNPWDAEALRSEQPVVACFRRGRAAHLFLNEDAMNPITMTDEQKKTAQSAEGDAPPKKDGEDKGAEMAAEPIDVKALCKAISDGSISVADMNSIMEAIKAAESKATADAPAPAAAPGAGEAMKAKPGEMSAEFAALRGELDAQKARFSEREALEVRRDDVAAAVKRLEGRPLGADLEEKLTVFHKSHGPAAFKAYVDAMAATFGKLPAGAGAAAAFGTQSPAQAPAAALKYQDLGVAAVEKAAKFAAEWRETGPLGRGWTRMNEERYVAVSMAREGFTLQAK